MESAHEVLVALAGRYAFGEVAALVDAGAAGDRLTTGQATQVRRLCAFGQRLLDLDAEDFGDDAVPADLTARARACRMPQSPAEHPRGALDSLRPAYRLLLEVIAVRWARREMAALVAAAHIAAEYLPLLAWEPVLGHAGDPARLAPLVRGTRFGVREDERCPHNHADRAAAYRVRTGIRQWQFYLDRQHSNVAHALGVCAAECRMPCRFVAAALHEPCRLALVFAESPLVRLRHAAPVGHGFGVPSPHEVTEAWAHTREHLAIRADDGYPLPGLPAFFGAVAGADLTPDTLLADTATAVVKAIA